MILLQQGFYENVPRVSRQRSVSKSYPVKSQNLTMYSNIKTTTITRDQLSRNESLVSTFLAASFLYKSKKYLQIRNSAAGMIKYEDVRGGLREEVFYRVAPGRLKNLCLSG